MNVDLRASSGTLLNLGFDLHFPLPLLLGVLEALLILSSPYPSILSMRSFAYLSLSMNSLNVPGLERIKSATLAHS